MASVNGEAAVGKICEMAVDMAVQKLAEEAKLLMDFREDFIWLNQELRSVRGFLHDAGNQAVHKEGVRQWLESIRNLAMRVEDIFEECAVQSMYGNDAQSCGLSCSQWIFRYRIGRKIKYIKDRIGSIIEEANQLNLHREVLSSPSTSQSVSVEWRRSTLLPSDSHPVGIQSNVDDMLSLLENSASPVIAVVGMGGMGKTYLLQHLYNTTRERYEKSIWLSVSQSYSVSNLQKNLAFQLDKDISDRIKDTGISEQVLAQLIYEKLQGKRCLVVLDDVWRASGEDWLQRLGLPTGNNSRCKIVVTTRSWEVCTNLNAQIYEMQCSSDEESWRLFCVYAFGENREPQQQLEEEGRKIVKECGNLPLAIKTIAASLASTTDLRDWKSKRHQLEGAVTLFGKRDPVMDKLKLSYDYLPAHLKECFGYLSFFPREEEINCEYLISLWIGEGFIPAGKEQWDMGWDCLYQLANLCLIQLWESKNLTKYCKIHDLLLDLVINISRENKCAFSFEEACSHTSGGWRRVLLAKKDIDDNAISKSHPVCLRTLSLSQNREITSIPSNWFTAMRRLRVLDLSSTQISTLPASVGQMQFLKALNLRGTKIEEVPNCVRYLKALCFLDVSFCSQLRKSETPEWIGELKLLQVLVGTFRRLSKGISKLASLRILRSYPVDFSMEEDGFMRLEDLTNMTQLQELWLSVNHEMEMRMMERGILNRLLQMRRLGIYNRMSYRSGMPVGLEIDLPYIPEDITAMRNLESLTLCRFSVPAWICGFANLRDLQLNECHCSDYPELQRMPYLVRVELSENERCTELPRAFGKSGGFPHLRFLKIEGFSSLEELPELEKEAMACLEELYLWNCPRVNKVGEGLELLERLKIFSYKELGINEIRETLKEGGGYWNRIKATNPKVIIQEG